jgi:hypothetical protein
MKILIDIPRDIAVDYTADKFKDCFERFIADCDYHGLAGRYEIETLQGLEKAFGESKLFSDAIVLDWNELYLDEETTSYIDDDGECVEDYRWVVYMDKYPQKNELVAILTKDQKIDYVVYDGYDFGEYDNEDIEAWAELPKELV